jgi:hypothetical protein
MCQGVMQPNYLAQLVFSEFQDEEQNVLTRMLNGEDV